VNNNFRIPYYVLLLAVFAVSFAGCSGSGDGSVNNVDDPNTKSVQVGTDVPLSSIASLENYDPESILFIEIEWTIVSRPPNSQATIINPDSATPSFRPDIVGEYVIKVVIKQGGVVLAENVVTIIAGVDDIYPTKTETHLLTTDICAACHSQEDWSIVGVDHGQVIGTCVSCHNGVNATGKSDTHIMSSDQCDVCHTTTTWGTPISGPDHTALIDSCVSCHNGVDASGKTATHINTSDMCDACHNVFPATWAPVPVNNVDHTQTLGSCASCHNNIIATGKTPNHIITSDDCGVCHDTAAWVPALSGGGEPTPSPEPTPPTDPTPPPTTVDHSGFTGNCITCHNGVDASGKSTNHPLTTDTCDACHGVTNWIPVLAVDHNQVIGTCESCHNGVSATGKGPNHLVTADDCAACHVTTRWLPALSPGGTTDPLPTKPANHMPTTDLCEACHLPNGWVIGSVDHDQVIGTCVTCHDGVVATGKSPTHIASSDNCDLCHVTTRWVAPALDHSAFVGTCVSCHNGVSASGKSATHINTTDSCEACHTVYPDPWVPIASVDHTHVLGTCESCHNSIIATGKSATHIQTTLGCSVCHLTTAWLPANN